LLIRNTAIGLGASVALLAFTVPPVAAHNTPGGSTGLSFTNTPLLRPDGGSEPAVTIGADGTLVAGALSWELFQTNVWKSQFGSTPTFQGAPDANIGAGIGGGDEDWEIGSTGTLHGTTLMFFFNSQTHLKQLGVSAITCPNADTSENFANCKTQIIDQTQADRQWITSNGKHVWISYHDSGSSSLIHVQRSDDDGFTWTKVGDPIVGQDSTTGDSTFNNIQGELEADPTTGILYDVYAAGVTGVLKGRTFSPNKVYVSRSLDGGMTWTATIALQEPDGSSFANVFPAIAVDPSNGDLYATASDSHLVLVTKSTDHGQTWSAPITVNSGGAATAVFPAIAARNGVVDLSYYGTTASSKDDPGAVWNVFLAQSTNAGGMFTQTKVSDKPNHVGVICTNGTGCAPGTRNMLDLFEDAIDPVSGKLAIIYTNDTLTTDSSGNPLPQVELAQQN
jgi:hypothetical protein